MVDTTVGSQSYDVEHQSLYLVVVYSIEYQSSYTILICFNGSTNG